jgi:hypothetical protein
MRKAIRLAVAVIVAPWLSAPTISAAADTSQAQSDAECFVVWSVVLMTDQSPKTSGAFFYYGARVESGRTRAETEALVKSARDRILATPPGVAQAIGDRCAADLPSVAHQVITLGQLATDRSSRPPAKP